jgi:hypothetical protein
LPARVKFYPGMTIAKNATLLFGIVPRQATSWP